MLIAEHRAMLAASGITAEFAMARGYETITDKRRLAELKITAAGRNVPGLLIPLLRVDGSTWGSQYRPDVPRLDANGRPRKYETPYGQRNGLDVPPGVAAMLGDPAVPLFITEGVKKGDAGAGNGLCIVDLIGTWNWLYTNSAGGKMAMPEWRDCALNNGRRVIIGFDSDMARNKQVQAAARGLAGYLATKGARIEWLWLPDTDEKTGLDDYLVEHSVEELMRLVKPTQPPTKTIDDTDSDRQAVAPKPEPVQPVPLAAAHKVFHRWLGKSFDTDALDIMLAAAAMSDDEGDPVWVIFISGSGNAKTELVQPLKGMGAEVTSAISSAGALLSATSTREKTADATGGLLPRLQKDGTKVLVVKDFTTILSMDRNVRAEVMAALREVYDGRYQRNVGTDGGKTLTWEGRLTVVGACTTAWDRAHAVISVMGNRFVLVRIDSEDDEVREEFGLQSIDNLGSETAMHEQLTAAVAGVLAGRTKPPKLTRAQSLVLVRAANLATKARTAVEVDFKGDVEDAHASEAPTRLAKQLAQVVRGAVALGIDPPRAMQLAIRCAADSLPPMRLAIVKDLAADGVYMPSTAGDVAKRIDKPRRSVDRQLQALHALGLATVKPGSSPWDYSLKAGVDPKVLDPECCAEMLVAAHKHIEESERGAKQTVNLPLLTFLRRPAPHPTAKLTAPRPTPRTAPANAKPAAPSGTGPAAPNARAASNPTG